MPFHINDKGDPGACKAQPGNCPFGSAAEHYVTEQEARAAYEASMAKDALVKTRVKADEYYAVK